MKSSQLLKRTRTNTKKGTIATESPKPGKGFERQDRLEQLCLNAPTPIRYLNPRERAREAQREKLGLINKEHQRELDILKKQNCKKYSRVLMRRHCARQAAEAMVRWSVTIRVTV
ncbi:uncharacterized protein LOC136066196 [Quercus suber]|uniref:uncharacterized protein LOC136066196 n=1 Tax=Quercus suber TaxID=58331 RepID=UPI0032E047C4